jgi:uncharacterized protein (TIGR03086 family)
VSDFINTPLPVRGYRGAMTTHSELFRTANARLTETLGTVQDWTASSPCADWTVRDVLDHLIDTERDFLGQHGIDAGPRPDTAEDPMGGWKAHAARVQDVLDTAELAETQFDGFFGPTTVGATLATFYGFDLLVHRWDIARGAGGDTSFTETELDLIDSSLDGFGEHLYMDGICRPALPVAADADRQTRILARMGRDAGWRPSVNA